MKMVIGSGSTKNEGWISTQESDLNVLSISDWDKIFSIENLDAMLAEHV
jgi:predicted SAM-dependent methyltransferase